MEPTHITIAETESSLKSAKDILSRAEIDDVIYSLALDPLQGVIIQETGGLRKIRVKRQGQGKRGGARVIYYYYDDTIPLYLFAAWAKNQKEDLSPADKAWFKKQGMILKSSAR